jgi:hypothetical protein
MRSPTEKHHVTICGRAAVRSNRPHAGRYDGDEQRRTTPVSRETRLSIVEVIARALQNGQRAREQAQQIYDLIGLTRMQVVRLERVAANVLASGRPVEQVDHLRWRTSFGRPAPW